MVYVSCIDKKIEKGNIVEYKLKDFEGNIEVISAEKLKGLISNAMYEINNEIYSGDYLMNVGINMSYFLEQNETRLFVVKKVND